MKAIILAAGLGSRLGDLTKEKPKSLIKVNGKPIIKYQIDAYLNAGISEILIVTGYKSVELENYIKINYSKNIKFINNINFDSTNNMYSLWLCKEHVINSEKVFISNADVVFDESIVLKMVNEKQNIIACDSSQYNYESMKISINSQSEITDISKKISKENSHACSIDLYCFTSSGINILMDEISKIIKEDKNQWTELAIQRIIKENKIKTFPFYLDNSERWFEIDNLEDLIAADSLFSSLKLKNKKHFIFDLDGTLYLGNTKINGASTLIKLLNSLKINSHFVSNNSSKNKNDYVKKLDTMGISIDENQIILSTDVTISSLLGMGFSSGYIIGNESFKQVLSENNIVHNDTDPEFVLIAYDTELTYKKLQEASIFLNNRLPYFATHGDKFCPTENGPIPDVGSFISLFETSNKSSPVIFGKPNKLILSKFFKNKVSIDDCVFVGDRLNTDFQLAINCGMDFICVLSGETNRLDIENQKLTPNLIVNSVKNIIELIQS
jgi:HAD superfamily hydrolase (TIGR01450 family)